jgi:MFS transporter, PPP family, 3-phenylpropionic acid transporter
MRCVTVRSVVMWSCRLPPFLRNAATETMTTDAAPRVSRRQLVPFAALSASYFAHIGFFNPYLPLWLKHLGLSLWMIGLLTSMQAVTRVFAPYLWGWLSDRSGERVPLMRWCAGMALLCSIGLLFNDAPWWLAAVLFLMFTHTSAMMPMSEAAMAHLVSHQGTLDVRRYGRIRLWGSVGFLVTVFVSGAWFETHGMGGFPMWTILTLVAINLSVWSLPNVREEVQHVEGQAGFGKVLRQPITLWFFATLFFHVLSHVAIYTFFSLYLDELGYGKDMIGVLWAVSVIVEIIGFFSQSRWLHWLSLPAWLCVCTGVMALRMGLTAAYGQLLTVLLLAQCLHVFTFAIQHTVCIAWLSQHFPGRLRGRGQALYAVVGYGLTGVLGALGGAALSTHFGLQTVFMAAMPVALMALLCAVGLLRASRRQTT